MEGIQNLSYQNDNGEKTFFNNDANLSPEIRNFLSDKKLDKTELQALHYILYNNENKEILNSTDNLSDLSNLLKYIPVHSDKYKVRNRVNQILRLTSNNIDKTNKIQNYNTLKKEARILGKEKISIFQKIIGAGEDGKFGPNTFRKYKRYNPNWKNESITEFIKSKDKNESKLNTQTLWESIRDIFTPKDSEIKQNTTDEINSHNNIMELINKFENYDNGRTIKNIMSLSDKYNFKNNTINFFLECIKSGYPIKIIEGKRTLKEQKYKIKKGWSKTIDSAHVKGLAIDVLYKGSGKLPLNIIKLGAKYNLMNGAEMWDGYDPGHFQAYYQGDLNKIDKRLSKMKKKGTLPSNYKNYK